MDDKAKKFRELSKKEKCSLLNRWLYDPYPCEVCGKSSGKKIEIRKIENVEEFLKSIEMVK